MTEYTPEQIAALLAGRTLGEWKCTEFHRWAEWGQPDPPAVWEVDGPDYAFGNAPNGSYDSQADAEFIAAAPAIVAQLLVENARAKHLLREMTRCIDWMAEGYTIDEYNAFYQRGELPPVKGVSESEASHE